MPFDGAEFFVPGERLQRLETVIQLIDDPASWGKGTLKSSDGRYCIRGAIIAAGGIGVLEPPILEAVNQVTGKAYARIEQFNDDAATNHQLVCRVLARTWENLADGTAVTGQRYDPSNIYVRGAWALIRCRDMVTDGIRAACEQVGRLKGALAGSGA